MNELKSQTNKDLILKRLKEYYVNGWTNKIKEENGINYFHKIKSELKIEDKLVYF